MSLQMPPFHPGVNQVIHRRSLEKEPNENVGDAVIYLTSSAYFENSLPVTFIESFIEKFHQGIELFFVGTDPRRLKERERARG